MSTARLLQQSIVATVQAITAHELRDEVYGNYYYQEWKVANLTTTIKETARHIKAYNT
jgi:hypothetical protein